MENQGVSPSRRTGTGRRLSSARERLLRELETRGGASTAELVAALGLHENTVRAHLDQLREDGQVRRIREPAAGRGRPAWRWTPVEPERQHPYAGLAATLADAVTHAAPDPVDLARDAGSSWGRRLAEAERAETRGAEETTAVIVEVMREQGFAPEVVREAPGDGIAAVVRLHRCPLLSAAVANSRVVCAVHEGMIEGIARAAGSDLVSRLTPFEEVGTCVLRLRASA
ncbi:MAG: helix-turn-helix domain-containing protein [Actinobacteria bacterium]|nr:helix-turn-helix domain-containing protein [Actinomycetota bacterium]